MRIEGKSIFAVKSPLRGCRRPCGSAFVALAQPKSLALDLTEFSDRLYALLAHVRRPFNWLEAIPSTSPNDAARRPSGPRRLRTQASHNLDNWHREESSRPEVNRLLPPA